MEKALFQFVGLVEHTESFPIKTDWIISLIDH